MTLYLFHHNFQKHFRIGGKGEDERSHAELAGYRVDEVTMAREGVWGERAISTRETLSELDKLTWFRKRVTPLKKGGEYLQIRVAA